MEFTDRTLLRLHVEAVWGVQLPASQLNEIELVRDAPQPKWRLYIADMTEGRIVIWRPDNTPIARKILEYRMRVAREVQPDAAPPTWLHPEVALALAAHPQHKNVASDCSVQLLTKADHSLIDTFDPGWLPYYLEPACQPLFGAIVSGRLVSMAHSSRRTSEACELGVSTLPDARQKGYAQAVTVAWTQAILQESLVPLYSADAANTASLRLAHAAGYRIFARAATYD